MKTPEELYANGIKKHYRHFFAAWPPNEVLRLGDIGILDGNLFVRIKNLEAPDINIGFVVREVSDPGMIDLTSETGVSIVVKAAGELNQLAMPNVPRADAGMSVEFTEKGAFILKAPWTRIPSIEDIDRLGKDIIEAYIRGRWNARWAVVVRVAIASYATTIISRSSKSRIEMSITGDFGSGPIDLVNTNLVFGVRAQSGDLFQSIGSRNVTPLFQLARIRKSLLGIPDMEIINKMQARRLLPTDLITPSSAEGDMSLEFDLITDTESGV